MKEDLKTLLTVAHISWFLWSFLIIIWDVSLRWDDLWRYVLWIGLVLFFLISLPLYTIFFFES